MTTSKTKKNVVAMRPIHLALLPLLGLLSGCGSNEAPQPTEADRVRDAVASVLQSHITLVNFRNEATAKIETSQSGQVWGRYCDELERIDLSACPADFRVAFRQHTRSCRDVQGAIMQVPSGTVDSMLVGFLNGLGGEADGGLGRFASDLKLSLKNGEATYREVERIALRYGAAL